MSSETESTPNVIRGRLTLQRGAPEFPDWILPTGDLFGVPAAQALSRIITFDGRLPIEHARENLLPSDARLFDEIGALPDVRLVPYDLRAMAGNQCDVFLNSIGRPHIRPRRAGRITYSGGIVLKDVASVLVPGFVFDRLKASQRQEQAVESKHQRTLDAWLHDIAGRGELALVLDQVEDSVRHVEAVCFYVGDRVFSNMEGHSTLVDRGAEIGLLTRLRTLPVGCWSEEERLAVAALRLLFLSGRSVRFEEFNGKTMTAGRLFRLFDGLAKSYEVIGPCATSGVDANAECIGRLAALSPGAPILRYRWISGLTYLKTERTTCSPTPEMLQTETPAWAVDRYRSRIGQAAPSDWSTLFEELADEAIAATLGGASAEPSELPATTPLESLIQAIVLSAAERVDADYAMSSSVRRPHVLAVTDSALRRDIILAHTPRDFFCCIVGRSSLRRVFGGRTEDHVYRAVQSRMQFNRWHFLPGNIPDVPDSRHYFYPPLVPDLAEWSDVRHAGHSRASVRYSIRCPGPDMHQPPLIIGGHPYRGFYDVRVVRMSGEPFTVSDLQVVRCRALWMGIVWSRIVHAIQTRNAAIAIGGFETGRGHEPGHPA